MGSLKQRACEIVEIPSKPDDLAGRAFDLFIIALIVLNVGAVMFETVGDNDVRYATLLNGFELFSLSIFVAEYVVRLWSITANPAYAHPVMGRLRFARTPVAVIDLIAILPAFLAPFIDLRFARVVRLLRLLKLTRYSDSTTILTRVMRSRAQALWMTFFLLMMALLLTSSVMYYAEHDAQPDAFASIPHAMWWGMITLTTTGYGDVVPITPLGQVLGSVASLIGIGVVALPVGILASGFMEELHSRQQEKRHPQLCPHCGEALDARGGAAVTLQPTSGESLSATGSHPK